MRAGDLVLGIDEAGRGPVLGPMVLAAVAVEPRAAGDLTRLGVCDSKAFGAGPAARARRAALADEVRRLAAAIQIEVVDVTEIDRRVRRGELNALERESATRLLCAAPPARRVVADGRALFSPLAARFPELEAHDHGEERHVAVAAASIIAKTRRDELFDCIAARYAPEFGPLQGGGYANAATGRFLRAYLTHHRRLPPEARRSWPWQAYADLLGPTFDPWAALVTTAPPRERPP